MSTPTAWSKPTVTGSAWGNSRYIVSLSATMNDTAYTMNDATLTIGDQKPNPIFGQATTYSETAPSKTAWTRS